MRTFRELVSEQLTPEENEFYESHVDQFGSDMFAEYFNSPRGKALIRLFLTDFKAFVTADHSGADTT